MPDSLRKVLLGTLIGAFIVGFAWHIAGERAKRAPATMSAAPPGAAAAGGKPGATAGKPGSGGAGGGPVIPVVATPSRIERLSLEVEALGTARASESIDVTSKVANVVTAIRFTEGQQVRKGDVLVELDGAQARADLAVAEAALKESTSQLQRSRELYETKVLSDQQIEQIESTYSANLARVAAARSRLSDTIIRAPFNGRVGLRRASVGGLVAPGTVITTLDDTSTIKLDFTVPERVVAAMKPGLTLEAKSVAYPGRVFEGTVASVDSRVDPNTRSVIVRALVPNGDGLLKPGMFLNVHLSRGTADVLVVPEESLVPEQGDVFIYVVQEGKASKRKIQTGQRAVGTVQVTDGLQAGEIVVTEGTQKLRDGTSVSVTEPAAAPEVPAAAGDKRFRAMKISEVSVKRPVFAAVISLMLVILGLLSASRLAVRELPDVEAPIVSIDTNYLGASADVVETKITQVIEERVAGLEGITKITSQSTDGRSSINLEFDPGRSVDEAANDVRDRVARVVGNLPPEADPPEVGKVDFGADPVIWLALSSDKMNSLELTDFAERELVDRFSVLPGVARVRMSGARRYAMRVWIDREALAARQLTVADIEASLRRENVQLPAGRLESSQRELTLRTETGLNTEQEFRELVVGRGAGGYLVRLGEVADVRLAAENERTISRTNGVPGISIGIEQISKANTLEVARAVRAERERVLGDLPAGTRLEVNLDRSVYIESSMMEVVKALLIAMALVIAVIYLFLGNLRATLIPAVTIPVSIIAAFIVMGALGFSINTLTLLGLVLAIGLVVDDAIVVLENIYRRMENGEPALIASVDGSREIGFAVVATTDGARRRVPAHVVPVG